MKTIFKRYSENPILKPEPDLWYAQSEARNPAAWFDGSKIHVLFTAATNAPKGNPIFLGHAVSSDGVHFETNPEPWLSPSGNWEDFDYGTVEDPRIMEVEGEVYVTYAARWFPYRNPSIGWPNRGLPGRTWTEEHDRRTGLLRCSRDLSTCERLGPLTEDIGNNANVVLFPRRFDGKYALLHRVHMFTGLKWNCRYYPLPIFMSMSESLMPWDWDNWQDDRRLLEPRQHEIDWEWMKLGMAGPPIETDAGWLLLYHAVDRNKVYRVGAAIADRENPWKILARTNEPLLTPEWPNEKSGKVPNVVFPCGQVILDDELYLYYGAADQETNLATCSLRNLVEVVMQQA